MVDHICENCGQTFSDKNDPRIKYCHNCRKHHHLPKIGITCVCLHCGIEFHPKETDRTKYCSRECAYAHKAAKPKPIKLKPICVICGKEFEGRPDSKHCSDECLKEHNRIRQRVRDTKERPCKWCGKLFTPETFSKTFAYCCEEHRALQKRVQIRKIRKNSANAKLHKGGVSKAKRLRVWARDGYVCQICGKKMRMDKAGTLSSGHPHNRAPTVDHIVPKSIALQLGWTNQRVNKETNLQAACFMCNVKKGNRAIGEQLRLC